MTDEELADALIERLNKMIEDPVLRKEVGFFLDIGTNGNIADRWLRSAQNVSSWLSVLGFINTIVGLFTEGDLSGCGRITAVYDDNGVLLGTRRTSSDGIIRDMEQLGQEIIAGLGLTKEQVGEHPLHAFEAEEKRKNLELLVHTLGKEKA